MAMNLEAVLRIAAKVVGLDEVTSLERGITGAERAAQSATSAFRGVAGSSLWQAAAVGAAGVAAGIGYATKAAIDFESSMANVRKVVDGLETPKAFAEIQAEILDLSNTMPIAASGFAEIYAAAGASGIAKGELKEFATLVAQVSVAFDMTAAEAGQSLAQLRVSLGLTTPQLGDLADAMNYLDNTTGASAQNLVDFMSRSGAVGKMAGLSATQTMAFGAAMIQAGVQTEVAATSFNNMVKALSRGPSMTDRQIDALRRLGYSMANAKDIESELSRAAETESRRRVDAARTQKDNVIRLAQEQSDRRIEIARNETDQLNREISRRYRNELQALQDNWDDQASAAEDALQDRTDAQVKALQRQQDAEITAAEKAAEASKSNATATTNAIRDAYESRIEAVRDAADREMTLMRRQARDQQQVVRDQLDDRKDAELQANTSRLNALQKQEDLYMDGQKAAAENRFKAIEEAERSFVDKAKANAKATGEEMARQSTQGFADRMQKDAIGTITEVFAKINNLPKSQQISVLSDLFGEEARGLAPMISNLSELNRILTLSSDTGARAGSVTKEYGVRVATAAAQIQLFWNQLNNTAIVLGTTVLPYLAKMTEVLRPVLSGLAEFAKSNQALTAVVVTIAGIGAAFVVAAPAILAAIVLLGQLKLAIAGLNLGGLIAGWLPAVVGFAAQVAGVFIIFAEGIIAGFGAALSWISGTFIPAVLAFFSGPVGLTVLVVAAVVALCVAFREPIMGFLTWLGQQFMAAMRALPAVAHAIFVQPFIDLWQNVLREPVTAFGSWVRTSWAQVTAFFAARVVAPIRTAWNILTTGMQAAWKRISDFLPSVFNSASEAVKSVFRNTLQFIANGINIVASLINRLISAYNSLPNFGDIPFIPRLVVPAFAEGGAVSRPTLAVVGENGEREYIVPESKMQAASARFLAGARGAAVIPSSGSAVPTGSAQATQINITTGPVLQQDGEQWATMRDLERVARATADGIYARLRTPAARMALGIR